MGLFPLEQERNCKKSGKINRKYRNIITNWKNAAKTIYTAIRRFVLL